MSDVELSARAQRLRFAVDPVVLTEHGQELRDGIEVATDCQHASILDAIGDDLDELLALVEPWAAAIYAGGGYPTSIDQLPPAWGRMDDPPD